MTLSDLIPYALAAAPPSIIALVTSADNPETLIAGAGSGAASVVAMVAVQLLKAHKEHLSAERERWAHEDQHRAKAEEHRQTQRLHWERANEQARDLYAAAQQVVTAVQQR